MAMQPPTLDLSKSHNAKPFAEEDFLQTDAYVRVKQLILSELPSQRPALYQAASDDADFYEQRGHYSILVNGKRGSGKTTFALSVLRFLERGTDEFREGEIINLGILDPTLIDSKEHVLLAVISKIKEKVETQYYQAQSRPQASSGGMFSTLAHPLDSWRGSLKNLAEGLQQLDGVGSDGMQASIWEDAVTLMEEGLESINAGLNLNQRLHQFIDHSLEVLGARAFALALDDIDTYFRRGWPVMETLRKYLTTNRLITLVCGDLELYQAQVKKNQWHQLGDLATLYEKDSQSHARYTEMVKVLTEQYLLKVLPAGRRIDLAQPEQLGSIHVVTKNDVTGQTLREAIKHLIQKNLGVGNGSAEEQMFRSFLLQSPLRMVIQLLSRAESGLVSPSSLEDIFSDWVYQYGVNGFLLGYENDPVLVPRLLDIQHSSGLLQADLELLPRYVDVRTNTGALVCSWILCAYFKKQPAKAMDYMLRGGLSRQAVYFEGVGSHRDEKDIMRTLGTTTSDDPVTLARQWSAVVVHGLSGGKDRPIHLGTVQLLSDSAFTKNRNKKSLRNLFRTSDKQLVAAYAEAQVQRNLLGESACPALAKGLGFLHRYYQQEGTKLASQHYALSPKEVQQVCQRLNEHALGSLAGSLFVIISQGSGNFYRASSLNLIGLVANLLLLADQSEPSTLALQGLVEREISKVGQIRTYPVPADYNVGSEDSTQDLEGDEEDDESVAGNKGEPSTDSEQSDDEENLTTSGTFLKDVADWLLRWKTVGYAGLACPPFVWSRIWQRFYYTLNQQDRSYSPNQRFLGEIIHRQVIAFLNAVLVEEQRYLREIGEGSEELKLILDNPVLADDVYEKNLSRLKRSGVKSPLFQELASCPVWLPFMLSNRFVIEPSSKKNSMLARALAEQQEEKLQARRQGYPLAVSKRDQVSPRICLADLLNLVAPARSESSKNAGGTPTLWTQKAIQTTLLEDKTVQPVLKQMFEGLKEEKAGEFIREHLSRTSNDATAKHLSSRLKGGG